MDAPHLFIPSRAARLVILYVQNRLTPEEQTELDDWLGATSVTVGSSEQLELNL